MALFEERENELGAGVTGTEPSEVGVLGGARGRGVGCDLKGGRRVSAVREEGGVAM